MGHPYISVPTIPMYLVKTSFLFYDIIMLTYCTISQCFDITGYDPKLSVLALKSPKTEIQPSINNFFELIPHLHVHPSQILTLPSMIFWYLILYASGLLTTHMKRLCTVLCLLILTQCVVDEPAQFHFPFSSCLSGLTLSTLNLLWLDLWDGNDWLNFGIGFSFQIVNWLREINMPASFQQMGVNGWLSSLVPLPTTGRVFSIV